MNDSHDDSHDDNHDYADSGTSRLEQVESEVLKLAATVMIVAATAVSIMNVSMLAIGIYRAVAPKRRD